MQETSEMLLEEKKRAIAEGREELGTGRGKDIMSVLRMYPASSPERF